MASSIDTILYIADQAGLGERFSYKRMFGEFGLYVDGKIVALVCDDQLFLKPTPQGQAFLGKVTPAPPYPGAKDYFLLAAELDEPERLQAVLQVTAEALPAPTPTPKPKLKSKPKTKPKSKSKSKSKSKRAGAQAVGKSRAKRKRKR
jgi:TfoX/Sxy family transcriptional regulator of competence genes